jgi:hypothetical protein
MLRHASVCGSLTQLDSTVAELRVVGRCDCGCPTVDFGSAAIPRGAPIADGTGTTPEGVSVGVIVWGHAEAITGLELYEMDGPIRSLPGVDTLRAW